MSFDSLFFMMQRIIVCEFLPNDAWVRDCNKRSDVILKRVFILQIRYINVKEHLLADVVHLFDDPLQLGRGEMSRLID